MTDPDPTAPPARAAIQLRGVSKHYGTGSAQPVAAADNVFPLRVWRARRAVRRVRIGASRPLLHLIGAIERPDSGTIINDGIEVTALRGGTMAAYRRTVGFVFQRYNLLPALTALDNVIAPVLPYRTGWEKAGPRPPAPGRGRPRRPGVLAALPDVRR